MGDFSLTYRDKVCRIPNGGYTSMVKNHLLDPDEIVKKTIDLFISSGVDFHSIHVYMSITNDGEHIVNLMARE